MICDTCIVCIDRSYITCTSWANLIVDLNTRSLLKSKNGFKHGDPFSDSKVVDFISIIVLMMKQMFDSQCMCSRQVRDMDIVTDTTAITAWIVITKHGDLFTHTDGSLCD